jgi:hypothetical protein
MELRKLQAKAEREVRNVDEDSLDREGQGGGDPAEAVVAAIAECLVHVGPPAVGLLRKLTDSFEDMCEATMAKDHAGLEDAGDAAVETLSKLLND